MSESQNGGLTDAERNELNDLRAYKEALKVEAERKELEELREYRESIQHSEDGVSEDDLDAFEQEPEEDTEDISASAERTDVLDEEDEEDSSVNMRGMSPTEYTLGSSSKIPRAQLIVLGLAVVVLVVLAWYLFSH